MIAGRLGGRELRAPRGRRTRPTSDRVREALFSILGDLTDNRVLDLYAGSGALGIEALSRGATHATFVESSREAARVLRENLERLELESSSTVVVRPVARAAVAMPQAGPFDLVLCDPPWAELATALDDVSSLLTPELLAPDARLVVEHPARERIALTARPDLKPELTRAWGDTAVTIFRR